MHILTPTVSRRVPWKNGLGFSLEIATDAATLGGEWPWRLSIADMPSRARFSPFLGEEFVAGEPLGPGVRDVNHMLSRDRWRGQGLALDSQWALVHAPGNTPVVSGRVAIAGASGSVIVACELASV